MCLADALTPAAIEAQLSGDPALCDALESRIGSLPIRDAALVTIAVQRIRKNYQERVHGVAGWSGWTPITDGWLIKISEDTDGVCLMIRGPEYAAKRFHSFALLRDAGTPQARVLRMLKTALGELA